MAMYSKEETAKLLTAFVNGEITETQFRSRLVGMNIPQFGIDTLMDGALQARAARVRASESSAGPLLPAWPSSG
jgi:hypothetical protein